jgi:hypothetical protein
MLMAAEPNGEAQAQHALIELSIESWRLCRLFERVLTKLDAGEATRYANQIRYFQKNLEGHLEAGGLKLVSHEGQPYDTGMAVIALNMEDFAPDDVLVVDRMVEPVVMGLDGVRKQGTVTLRKAQP